MKRWCICAGIILIMALVSCQPQADDVLPTLIDLNGTLTQVAVATAAAATPTNPPLPATWTPSPVPSVDTPSQVVLSSPTPEAMSQGFIYYIFNGDSIVRLFADGSFEDLILVSGAPTDLTLAPDGSLLAFVAQGNGSAREVYVLSPDGSYRQQISCLGYSQVIQPVWSPDSQTLAFIAAPSPGSPASIYTAAIIGSGSCPTGNNQHAVTQLLSSRVSNLVWDPNGGRLYFTMGTDERDAAIYAVEVADGLVYPPLTSSSGFGPDFSLAPDPLSDWMYYLKSIYDLNTRLVGGTLYQFDRMHLTPPVNEIEGVAFAATRLRWSPDAKFLLVETPASIFVVNRSTNNSVELVRGTLFLPQAAFSPDSQVLVYVDGGRDNPAVQQLFTVSRLGGNPRQLTSHGDGTINNPVWGRN